MRGALLVATAAVAAGFAGSTPATGSPPDRELLDRYRPILRYDAAEEYFAQPVSLPPGSAARVGGDRVYGHTVHDGGETWLQYWFFYAYNSQDRGIVRTGRHEGDWELFQLRLGDSGRPEVATLSQHSWAEGCAWDELERERNAPVLYVANASHAVYARPGDHDRPFPDPTDEADGDGRRVRPQLALIEDGRPDWVRYAGRWGDTEAGVIPGEAPSPRGPMFQEAGAWSHPAAFHAEHARACGSGAPGRWWALPAAVGVAVLIAGILVLGLRAAWIGRRPRSRR